MLGAKCYQIVLIKQCWTRPNQTEIPGNDAEQLGNSFKAGLTQKTTYRSQILQRILDKVSGQLRSVRPHASEFGHSKQAIVFPHTSGPMKDWPFEVIVTAKAMPSEKAKEL